MKYLSSFKIVGLLLVFIFLFPFEKYSSPFINLDEKLKKADNYINHKKHNKAIQTYVNIIQNYPHIDSHKKSRALNNIGYCYYKKTQYKKATLYYKKALKIDKKYFLCLSNISAALIKQDKYKEALQYLKRGYKLNDSYIKLVFNFFVAYAELGSKEKASHYLKRAFEIDEEYTKKRLKKNNISKKQIEKIQEYLK